MTHSESTSAATSKTITSPPATNGTAKKVSENTVVTVKKELNGGEILIQSLLDQGVDTIFGYPGGVVLGVYDTLFKTPKLRHILVRHEQGGTHMADGYARATGKPGVILATSGPGATNTVTGITTAMMDSIPWWYLPDRSHPPSSATTRSRKPTSSA